MSDATSTLVFGVRTDDATKNIRTLASELALLKKSLPELQAAARTASAGVGAIAPGAAAASAGVAKLAQASDQAGKTLRASYSQNVDGLRVSHKLMLSADDAFGKQLIKKAEDRAKNPVAAAAEANRQREMLGRQKSYIKEVEALEKQRTLAEASSSAETLRVRQRLAKQSSLEDAAQRKLATKAQQEAANADQRSSNETFRVRRQLARQAKSEEAASRREEGRQQTDAARMSQQSSNETYRVRRQLARQAQAETIAQQRAEAKASTDAGRLAQQSSNETFRVRQAQRRAEAAERNAEAKESQRSAMDVFRIRQRLARQEQSSSNSSAMSSATFNTAPLAGQIRTLSTIQSLLAAGRGDLATSRFGADVVGQVGSLAGMQARLAAQTGNVTSATMLSRQSHVQNAAAMREVHSVARGLGGSMNALWLTYGSIAGLGAGAAVGGLARGTYEVGKDLQYRLKMLEALGNDPVTTEQMMPAVQSSMKTPLEAAEALQALSQAGLNSQQAIIALDTALKLSVLGEMKAPAAANAITGALAAFNLGATDAARVGDVFGKAAAISNTNVQGITDSMKQASTAAADYNISIEEVSAGLATMAKRNITGSAAGTSYRNLLKELYTPIARGKEAMEKLGISAYTAENKMKPLSEVLTDVRDKLVGLNEQSRNNALEAMFGERGGKAIRPILDDLDAYKDKVEQLGKSQGFLSSANLKLVDTVEGASNRMQSSLQRSFAGAFDNVEPQIKQVLLTLNSAFSSKEFESSLTTLARGVTGVTSALIENADWVKAALAGYVGFKVAAGSVSGLSTAWATGSAMIGAARAKEIASKEADTVVTKINTAATTENNAAKLQAAVTQAAATRAGVTGIAAQSGAATSMALVSRGLGILGGALGWVSLAWAGYTLVSSAFARDTPALMSAADNQVSKLVELSKQLRQTADEQGRLNAARSNGRTADDNRTEAEKLASSKDDAVRVQQNILATGETKAADLRTQIADLKEIHKYDSPDSKPYTGDLEAALAKQEEIVRVATGKIDEAVKANQVSQASLVDRSAAAVTTQLLQQRDGRAGTALEQRLGDLKTLEIKQQAGTITPTDLKQLDWLKQRQPEMERLLRTKEENVTPAQIQTYLVNTERVTSGYDSVLKNVDFGSDAKEQREQKAAYNAKVKVENTEYTHQKTLRAVQEKSELDAVKAATRAKTMTAAQAADKRLEITKKYDASALAQARSSSDKIKALGTEFGLTSAADISAEGILQGSLNSREITDAKRTAQDDKADFPGIPKLTAADRLNKKMFTVETSQARAEYQHLQQIRSVYEKGELDGLDASVKARTMTEAEAAVQRLAISKKYDDQAVAQAKKTSDELIKLGVERDSPELADLNSDGLLAKSRAERELAGANRNVEANANKQRDDLELRTLAGRLQSDKESSRFDSAKKMDEDQRKFDELAMSPVQLAMEQARVEVADIYNSKIKERQARIESLRETLGASFTDENELVTAYRSQIRELEGASAATQQLAAVRAQARAESQNTTAYGSAKAMRDYSQGLNQEGDQAFNTVNTAIKTSEDTLASFFATGKVGWKGLADTALNELGRIAARQLMKNTGAGDYLGKFVAQGIGMLTGSANTSSGVGATSMEGMGNESLNAGVSHSGSLAGASPVNRSVHADMFGAAPRFHGGGVVGAGEVPVITQHGEGIFTPAQMKALGPSSSGQPVVINQTITVDARADRASINEAMKASKAEVLREVADQFNRDGNMRRVSQ